MSAPGHGTDSNGRGLYTPGSYPNPRGGRGDTGRGTVGRSTAGRGVPGRSIAGHGVAGSGVAGRGTAVRGGAVRGSAVSGAHRGHGGHGASNGPNLGGGPGASHGVNPDGGRGQGGQSNISQGNSVPNYVTPYINAQQYGGNFQGEQSLVYEGNIAHYANQYINTQPHGGNFQGAQSQVNQWNSVKNYTSPYTSAYINHQQHGGYLQDGQSQGSQWRTVQNHISPYVSSYINNQQHGGNFLVNQGASVQHYANPYINTGHHGGNFLDDLGHDVPSGGVIGSTPAVGHYWAPGVVGDQEQGGGSGSASVTARPEITQHYLSYTNDPEHRNSMAVDAQFRVLYPTLTAYYNAMYPGGWGGNNGLGGLANGYNSYFSSNPSLAPAAAPNDVKLDKLFSDLRDPEGDGKDELGAESVMKYATSLGVDPEKAGIFVLMELVKAPSLGVITRQGFVDGWKMTTAQPTKSGQKDYIQLVIRNMQTDPEIFKRVYRYAFIAGKESPEQRAVPLDNALIYWQCFFGADQQQGKPWVTKAGPGAGGAVVDWFSLWSEYLRANWTRTVSKDMWNQTHDFAIKTLADPTLAFWSADGAWPSVVDNFVEWVRGRGVGVAPGASMEVDS